jgi:drug/metabolite transporter (DMT)-like permease
LSSPAAPEQGVTAQPRPREPDWGGLAYVGLAVAFFSTSPVLTRLAAPHSPFEITFGRMAVSAVCVLLLARLRGVPLGFRADEIGRFAFYGLVTAAHFLFYIWSLQLTTIAHALALVYTAPIFVTVFAGVVLGERIDRRRYLGIPLVLLGVAVLSRFETRLDMRMAAGDGLAMCSAIAFGLYSIAGRHERDRQPLLRYAGGVYAAAAIWLLPLALLTATGWHGLAPALAVVGLGVLPAGVGHTLYNASLRRVHPTFVNLIATQEVTGGVLLGALLLGEVPGTAALAGVALMLLGIAIVLVPWESRRAALTAGGEVT